MYLNAVIAIAQQAGNIIRQLSHDGYQTHRKQDHSLVTTADLLSQQYIVQQLKQLTPDIPIIGEEQPQHHSEQRQSGHYWLVDPLDGTKGFLDGSGEYSVNIALMKQHQPVLSVIAIPEQQLCYYASHGQGAYKQYDQQSPQKISTRSCPASQPILLASRHHRQNQSPTAIAQLPDVQYQYLASALKFCLIAEGKADAYLRIAPTKVWDTAAGQGILQQAGGLVLQLNTQALTYSNYQKLQNPSFLAVGDGRKDWSLLIKQL